ncbi:hypothetical protein DXG03_008834 [Asterophora parasitica]|uniref:F-box domain-containing protein n=1 Tax=Asterophora parasitica TaxID=117018 RepID=A0A9P7G7B0_9AGAR|nr:hypothetical protein DXG03_008834 [Asterophora parasitica]
MSSDNVDSDILARASSISHVLRTNAAPSTIDIIEIRRLLRDVDFERVTRLRDLGATGQQSGALLENLAASCRSSLSIIRRMPSEMLCAIFSLTIPEPYDFINQPLNSMDARQSPSVLTQVCRSWRAIALSHNELWSHIRINLEMVALLNDRMLPKLSTLELFLKRSGAHPLYIHFGDFYPQNLTATQFLSVLMTHSHRWKEVSFFLEFSRLQMLEAIRGHLPLIYRLDVRAFGAHTYGPLRAFDDAPQLREAFLDLGDPLATLPLPWSQLTTVGGNFDHASILPHTPNVVECLIESNPSSASSIRHPSLKKLRVKEGNVLHWLEAPGLEELQLYSRLDMMVRDVTSFISKSGCVLQSLSLYNIIEFAHWMDLKGLWMSLSSLTELQIRFCALDWDIFSNQLSSTQPGASALLPNLQHIVFVFIKRGRFYLADSVLDLLESRRQTSPYSNGRAAQLLSAGLFNANISQQSRDRLSALQDLGLELTLGMKRTDE